MIAGSASATQATARGSRFVKVSLEELVQRTILVRGVEEALLGNLFGFSAVESGEQSLAAMAAFNSVLDVRRWVFDVFWLQCLQNPTARSSLSVTDRP
jgi:hypothetical protein